MTTLFLFFLALIPVLLIIGSFFEPELSVAALASSVLWWVISYSLPDKNYTTYETVALDCQIAHNILYVKAQDYTFTFEKLKDIEEIKNLKTGVLEKQRNTWNGFIKAYLLKEIPTKQ